MLRLILTLSLFVFASAATALEPREGWQIVPTGKSYDETISAVRAAVKAAPINIVTQASASSGAQNAGISIPGNRVFGLYRNDYARRMLDASIAAGIEAPIRLYVTENPDGTATLSYKTPSAVFAPYMAEGGEELRALATELDAIFAEMTQAASAD